MERNAMLSSINTVSQSLASMNGDKHTKQIANPTKLADSKSILNQNMVQK